MKFLKPYFGRLAFTVIGLIISILFLSIGFWKTILIILCCGIGFSIGMVKDKIMHLPEWFWFWRDRL